MSGIIPVAPCTHELVRASRESAPSEKSTNFMLAVVKGIEPRDQVEAMLAAQMAAVHNATMTFARRLAHVDNIPQQDSAERAFNKLARTFAVQVEALKRYRSRGVNGARNLPNYGEVKFLSLAGQV